MNGLNWCRVLVCDNRFYHVQRITIKTCFLNHVFETIFSNSTPAEAPAIVMYIAFHVLPLLNKSFTKIMVTNKKQTARNVSVFPLRRHEIAYKKCVLGGIHMLLIFLRTEFFIKQNQRVDTLQQWLV